MIRAGHFSGQARIFTGSTRKSTHQVGFDPFRAQPEPNIAVPFFLASPVLTSGSPTFTRRLRISGSHPVTQVSTALCPPLSQVSPMP
nr:hypothetical protein Iba_chr06dCG8250 [Ipomoea batatas]